MFSWFFFHLSLPVCSPLPFTLVSSVSRLIQMRKKLRLLPSSYSQWSQAKTQLGIYYLSKTFDPEVNFVVNSITLKHLKNWFKCDYQSGNLFTIWGDNGKSWETWKKHTLISVLFFSFLFLYFSFPFIHFAYFFFISSVLHKFCVCWTIIDFC